MFAQDQIVGKYRIIRSLGSGGFGAVYLAEDTLIGKRVALKVPHRQNQSIETLSAEAKVMAPLNHPHIVSVFDYQVTDPAFIVMEYVVGRDLQTWLDDHGPLGVSDALSVIRQVGEALAHAHGVGLLHRDVKPSNVIVTERLEAKLVDFGLARNVERLSELTTQVGTPGQTSRMDEGRNP